MKTLSFLLFLSFSLTINILQAQTDSSKNIDEFPKSSGFMFATFDTALLAVFDDAKNNFAKYKGDLYKSGLSFKTNIDIQDTTYKAESIYLYVDHGWSFKFSNSGSALEEGHSYDKTDQLIRNLLECSNLKFVKSIYPSNNNIDSFEYNTGKYQIIFLRRVSNDNYSHDIIIHCKK